MLYTAPDGTTYLAVGRCPRSELTAGARYAVDGDPTVYTCGREAKPRTGDRITDRVLGTLWHGDAVILLEPESDE